MQARKSAYKPAFSADFPHMFRIAERERAC